MELLLLHLLVISLAILCAIGIGVLAEMGVLRRWNLVVRGAITKFKTLIFAKEKEEPKVSRETERPAISKDCFPHRTHMATQMWATIHSAATNQELN